MNSTRWLPEGCPGRRGRFLRRYWHLGVAAVLFAGANGCTLNNWHLLPEPEAPPPPADAMVLRGDQLEPDHTSLNGFPKLQGAHDLYRRGEFAKAERLFCYIADDTHNAPQVAEEARFYQAECLRHLEKYPKASDLYNRLLIDFPSGMHRDQAVERKFEIANYWLDDTREEIRRDREAKENKNWFVMPVSWVHTEKSKPFLDEEGRAIEALDQVAINGINGPRADEALFLAGSVRFFREDYRDADRYFSQLVEMYPNSRFAARAVELAIISKHMSTGGADYDGRKVAEARKLVDSALRNYPELAQQKTEFLERQLIGITMQQAEKDWKVAEFYRRTGHPGSAYFYYEIVCRRYPKTQYAEKAAERKNELRAKLDHPDHVAADAAAAKPAPQPPAATPPATLPAPTGSPSPYSPAPGLPEMAPPPRPVPPPTTPSQPELAPTPRPVPAK